ncbi:MULTISPECIES: hypothetical protein [Streptomyces]|uniref:hypothetical protein n=1 Tax=Streptomyces TaxID=1883 RepID=UPI0004BD30DE|nr:MULTISPECIES: hypothetical protein [Streptomyces]SCD62887.1 hypothetical protein GA0115249_106433 [Streptomyces sp. PpalLS-921]
MADLSFYISPLSEEIREEGRVQGRAEAREEGRVQAWVQGILYAFDVRGIDVTDEMRRRVATCGDMELLRHWLGRAVVAGTAAEVFREEPTDRGPAPSR